MQSFAYADMASISPTLAETRDNVRMGIAYNWIP